MKTKHKRTPASKLPRLKGRVPEQLYRCGGCGRHLHASERSCAFCGVDLVKLEQQQAKAKQRAEAALATLAKLLG